MNVYFIQESVIKNRLLEFNYLSTTECNKAQTISNFIYLDF